MMFGIERADEVIERRQRRDLAAGGDVDVHAERREVRVRMIFGIRVHRDVALVEVAENGLARGRLRPLRDEDGHARALGIVVLPGDVEHRGADHVRERREDGGETLGIVLLVDVRDVVALFARSLRVAHVVDVETQRLREVVEPVQLHLFAHCADTPPLRFFDKKNAACPSAHCL